MNPTDLEKRHRERVDVEGAVLVFDSLLDRELGKLVNLHEKGFMLISNLPIEEGSIYQLKFFPLPPVDDVAEMSVGAECLWVSETDSGDQIWAGFQIIDIAESDQEVVTVLIEKFPLS